MSWHSAIARYYKPNVFGPGFSWYQDKASDNPMRAKKIPDASGASDQNPQTPPPQLAAPQPSWQTAAPQGTQAGKQGSVVWVLLLVILAAVVLFAFFA